MGNLMCRVSLEESAGVRSVAEWEAFVESGFLCPGRGFGWLGLWGWGCSSWGSRLVHQGGVRAGVPRPVWTVSISGSGLAWASLGMGGLRGFGTFFCFAVGQTMVPFLGHPIYPHFLKYSKYSTL